MLFAAKWFQFNNNKVITVTHLLQIIVQQYRPSLVLVDSIIDHVCMYITIYLFLHDNALPLYVYLGLKTVEVDIFLCPDKSCVCPDMSEHVRKCLIVGNCLIF